jgi:hypothetical protein
MSDAPSIGPVEVQRAFLAVSAALGEPPDPVVGAGGDAAPRLQSPSRESRARELATILTQVLGEIDAVVLA